MTINNVQVNLEEVAVTEKTVVAEDLLSDLKNGLTWYKKDDLGYGSIQEKYNANVYQIQLIRKLPILQNVKTEITVFNIVTNDTKQQPTSSTETNNTEVSKPETVQEGSGTVEAPIGTPVTESTQTTDSETESSNAFLNI